VHIFVSHGEKGGVGKSTVAALVADRALAAGMKLAIVETDNSIPDVQARFEGNTNVVLGRLALGADPEAAISRLGSWLERQFANGIEAVVINTPASAAEVFDRQAEVLGMVVEGLDADLTACFAMGPSAEAIKIFEASCQSGLMSLSAARRVVLLAGHLGEPEAWPWWPAPARHIALKGGFREFTMRRLTDRVMSQVRAKTGAITDLAGPAGGLTIADRALLFRWLREMRPACSFMLGIDDDEAVA
jgi:hypothetical protein